MKSLPGYIVVGACVLAACITHRSTLAGQVPEELTRGRQVTFQAEGSKVTGELLGFDGDRLVLLHDETVNAWPLAELRNLSVRQHGLDFGGAMRWAAIGGGVTGLALTSACSTVEDASCGVVFPAVFLSWGLVGALFGATVHGSSRLRLPADQGALRPYARFPQGVPPAFSARAVTERGGRIRR